MAYTRPSYTHGPNINLKSRAYWRHVNIYTNKYNLQQNDSNRTSKIELNCGKFIFKISNPKIVILKAKLNDRE